MHVTCTFARAGQPGPIRRDDCLQAYFPEHPKKPETVLVRVSTLGDGYLADYRLVGETVWRPAHPATRFELDDDFV